MNKILQNIADHSPYQCLIRATRIRTDTECCDGIECLDCPFHRSNVHQNPLSEFKDETND